MFCFENAKRTWEKVNSNWSRLNLFYPLTFWHLMQTKLRRNFCIQILIETSLSSLNFILATRIFVYCKFLSWEVVHIKRSISAFIYI